MQTTRLGLRDRVLGIENPGCWTDFVLRRELFPVLVILEIVNRETLLCCLTVAPPVRIVFLFDLTIPLLVVIHIVSDLFVVLPALE
jgi:hypothetical protein